MLLRLKIFVNFPIVVPSDGVWNRLGSAREFFKTKATTAKNGIPALENVRVFFMHSD